MNDSRFIEALFNRSSLGIVVLNSHGVIQTINPYGLELFGYSKEEILNQAIDILIPFQFREAHTNHQRQYLHQPKNRPMGLGMDLLAVRKNGTEFPVEISLADYQDEGKIKIIAFVVDISIRKKALEDLKKLSNELENKVIERTRILTETLHLLEASKENLQHTLSFQTALLNNAAVMIIGIDTKGVIQAFNPEAERELGYKSSELIGYYKPFILHHPLNKSQQLYEITLQPLNTRKKGISLMHLHIQSNFKNADEWIYTRKDGTKFPVQLSITKLLNDEHAVIGYVGVAINISKTKKMEQDLQQALEKEKESSDMKTRFASMASHEFRTPLSAVLSSTYLLKRYTILHDQEKLDKHIDRIISSVNILNDILNDFLSLGQIEEGRIQLRLSQFNISELIILTTNEFSSLLKPGQEIRCLHEGATEVKLDSNLLRHILMNLVSNASKFSPENSLIDIKTSCDKNKLQLTVKDEGIGISVQDQKHLMERFFRGGNAGNIQGTGLGLHIISKYAELMNGKITCHSEPNKGAEFIITFNLI